VISQILEDDSVTPFIAFPSLSFQPFTEVTLHIVAQQKPHYPLRPTALSKNGEGIWRALQTPVNMSFRIQRVAERGLEKLHKYLEPAKLHHSTSLEQV